jgi:LacI family gluconate utilization system Gnt-I transcriptional repressor
MVESVPHWDGPIVTYSRPRAAAEAADVLVERGYQRLGFFSLVPDEGAKQLEASFCERADQLGRPVPPGRRQYLFQTVQEADAVWEELSQQQSQARVAQLLEAQAKDPERPEAYFVAYQPHAERMLMAAGQLGLRLPQDLGIITTGASTRSTPMSAMIDTIGIDSRQIGRRAAQLLRHALGGHRPEAADATIELEVQRLCGTTLRPA